MTRLRFLMLVAITFFTGACQITDITFEDKSRFISFIDSEFSAILDRGGFEYDSENDVFTGYGLTLNASKYQSHVSADGRYSTYAIKIIENDPRSFANLVIEPLTVGHRMYIQRYTFEGAYAGMHSFTGTVSRQNLDGTSFNEYGFINGQVSSRRSANAKEAMCVVGVGSITVCTKMVKYNALGDEKCVQYSTIEVIIVEECGDDSPPDDDYIPPAGGSGGGGTYVPPGNPVSGPGSPGGTPPVDDGSVNGGNNPTPIPGYKPPIPVIDDGEIPGVMSPWAAQHIVDRRLAQCMKDVMNNLKNVNQGDVGKLIQRFNSDPGDYNWEVSDGQINNNRNAQTIWDPVKKVVRTQFDNRKFAEGSNLAMARTILHEAIHAYVVATMINTVGNQEEREKLLGPGWTEALANYGHDYMARHYLQPLADALKEYGTCMGYNLPDQFYQDLAWGGLATRDDMANVDTEIFKELVPDPGVRERIKNVINIEQVGRDIHGQPQPKKGRPTSCLAN